MGLVFIVDLTTHIPVLVILLTGDGVHKHVAAYIARGLMNILLSPPYHAVAAIETTTIGSPARNST